MKKSISKIFLGFSIFALFLTGCASTKQSDTISSDDYSSSATQSTSEELEDEELDTDFSAPENVKNSGTGKKAKKKNSMESLFSFGNKNDFVSKDTSSVFTKTVTGSIKQKKATILINPENQTAGFGSTYMSAYYIVQLDAESRAKLAKAVEFYLNDFDNKKLDRKDKKSYKKYGSFKIHLDWGTLSSSTPNHGDGNAYFGYEFQKGSPYFTITCFSIHNDHWDVIHDATTEESMQLKYYFTKALAKEFVEYVSEDRIAEFLSDYVSDTIFKPVEIDDYE